MLSWIPQKNKIRKEKQARYLSQAIQLEEAVNPYIIKTTMGMVSLAILCFLIWASFTQIDEVARTPGEVIPSGYQKTVQHLDGGMVKQINVREGQIVQEGDVLLVLNERGIIEDYERAQNRHRNLEAEIERLIAFTQNRDPDFSRFTSLSQKFLNEQKELFNAMRQARSSDAEVIQNQIEEKRQLRNSLTTQKETAVNSLRIATDMYQRRKKLNKKGYASDMQLLSDEQKVNDIRGNIAKLDRELEIAETQINEYEKRLKSLSAGQIDDVQKQLNDTRAEAQENQKIIEKLEERLSRLEIKSPADGLVKGFSINTVGAIITPGQVIMDIIPTQKSLEIEVKISPRDIGHVKVGQSVQTKFSTFDFSRYGFVTGTLEHISATTFSAENGERYYRGKILLDQHYVGQDTRNVILPGMTVMADIITGQKTILQYLLKPIHLSIKSSFSER